MHLERCDNVETAQSERVSVQIQPEIADRIDARADWATAWYIAGVQKLAEQEHVLSRYVTHIKVHVVHKSRVWEAR